MRILLSFLFCLYLINIYAQRPEDKNLVQFSGVVLTEENNDLVPIPFTNIVISGSQRGTYADLDGFFTIVGEKGDTVLFSAVGFKLVEYVIPDTLAENRYSIYQLMSQDTILLPETVVYPWPSREYFKIEFLAMDVSDEIQSRATENLAEKAMREMREHVPTDGNENADYYLRQQANSYYYSGQFRPMNIFNPIAWKQFFDAWKRGDFKKKSKK